MTIACLGWGSLIWHPSTLPFKGKWFEDGPFLPIEFARESGGHRITLVISPGSQMVRSLWTLLSSANASEAKQALASREGTSVDNIGIWERGAKCDEADIVLTQISQWALQRGLDAVLWTALQPGFKQARGTTPKVEEVIKYLNDLTARERKDAELYIRMTPRQITTDYRQKIEKTFDWTPYVNT
jgi:hypothetical protein